MENSASCVKIPARIAGIPIQVCRIPVISPASMPARKAHSIATHTFAPCVIITMHTAPPVAIVPSTVRSARSSTLKVMNTPIAISPQIKPCSHCTGKCRKAGPRKSSLKFPQTIMLSDKRKNAISIIANFRGIAMITCRFRGLFCSLPFFYAIFSRKRRCESTSFFCLLFSYHI